MRSFGFGLLLVLLLASCDDGASKPSDSVNSVIGTWQWSGKVLIPDLSATDSFDLRWVITLRADSSASYAQYFSSKYDKGGNGPWKLLAHDTVGLKVVDCFKGDANGVAKPNTCAEDFSDPELRFSWNGSNLSVSTPSQTWVFKRID